MQRNHTAQ